MPAALSLLAAALLSPVLVSSAHAGDVVIHTTVPAAVDLGTTPLVRTFGERRLRVRDMQPGVADLRIVRGDRTDVLQVVVPDDGAALVEVHAESLGTEPLKVDADAEPAPILELRAAVGQRFAAVLDGQRIGVIGDAHPVRVEGVEAGQHDLELRTQDLTVVWMRGQLDLRTDDYVIVTGQEGYAPLVSGRPDAFRLLGAPTQDAPATPGSGTPQP